MRTWREFLAEMELKPVKKVIANPQTGLAPVFKPQGPSTVVRPLAPLQVKPGTAKPRPSSTVLKSK